MNKKDRNAQKAFFLKFYSFVYSISQRYVTDHLEIEEITNDVFLQIFSKSKLYNDKYSIKSWIKKITVNKCIDKYRKDIKNLKVISLDEKIEIGQSYDPFWEENDFDQISRVLIRVPIKYRLIFNMYVFEDYSHQDISEKLNIPIGTSKSAVSRAKKIIKEYYLKSNVKNELRAKSI